MQVVKRPDDALLAFLLGIAIGVMFLLSLVELWLRNAAEHGWAEVTFAVLLGALAYQLLQPFIPDFQTEVLAHSAASEASPPLGWAGHRPPSGPGFGRAATQVVLSTRLAARVRPP